MWPLDRIRKPSLLRELLTRLQLIHASQVETNGLLRELLMQHGKSPATPPAISMPWQPPTSASGNHPSPSGWTAAALNPHQPRDTRKRTNRDVTTTSALAPMAGSLGLDPTQRLMTEQELREEAAKDYERSLGPAPPDV